MNLLIFVVILLIKSVQGSKNYCDEDVCNNSKQHTLCKYQSNLPAPNCIDYEKLIKDEKDKQSVLHKINDRRNKVAAGEIRSLPSAENMMRLVWNEELAISAQRWADQCVQHSTPDVKDTCRDLGNIAVGQNIATIYGDAPGLTPVALVDVWYTELLNINASIITRYQPSMETSLQHYDYFTQLAWADSREVGCGAIVFRQSSGTQRNETVYRLVCNFAPSGNRVGETVYADGVTCSRCPEKGICDEEYLALCHPNSKLINEETTSKINISERLNENNECSTRHKPDSTTEKCDYDVVEKDSLSAIDYLFKINNYTTEKITITTENRKSFQNTLDIDELLDLLKRKLSTDPMFKNMLTTVLSTEQTENGFSDSGVKAFINKIYNPKDTMMSTKSQEIEKFNPTLLADLVEAVIFRSDKYTVAHSFEPTAAMESSEVHPVKIQAELAEVKPNDGFTGHYFFPEDDNEKEGKAENDKIETRDTYYDVNSEIPVSDVLLELEILKKQATKDFIDDILESDSVTETTGGTTTKALLPDTMSLFKSGHNNMKKFLDEIGEKQLKLHSARELQVRSNKDESGIQNNQDIDIPDKRKRTRRDDFHESIKDTNEKFYLNSDDDLIEAEEDPRTLKEAYKDSSYYIMGYKRLLQKLNRDIRQLNLQQNFHCSRCDCYLDQTVVLLSIIIIEILV